MGHGKKWKEQRTQKEIDYDNSVLQNFLGRNGTAQERDHGLIVSRRAFREANRTFMLQSIAARRDNQSTDSENESDRECSEPQVMASDSPAVSNVLSQRTDHKPAKRRRRIIDDEEDSLGSSSNVNPVVSRVSSHEPTQKRRSKVNDEDSLHSSFSDSNGRSVTNPHPVRRNVPSSAVVTYVTRQKSLRSLQSDIASYFFTQQDLTLGKAIYDFFDDRPGTRGQEVSADKASLAAKEILKRIDHSTDKPRIRQTARVFFQEVVNYPAKPSYLKKNISPKLENAFRVLMSEFCYREGRDLPLGRNVTPQKLSHKLLDSLGVDSEVDQERGFERQW